VIACRAIATALLLTLLSCSRAPEIPAIPRAQIVSDSAVLHAVDAGVAGPKPLPDRACAADDGCGYDPVGDRCVGDPRANRQPPLVDQGIVCYCDALRCRTLRVPPVPCESDASCAVREDPRPHPVAADADHPHRRGRACRDFVRSTTCERTNICTMRTHRCRARPR
jgi:hypothetical protein